MIRYDNIPIKNLRGFIFAFLGIMCLVFIVFVGPLFFKLFCFKSILEHSEDSIQNQRVIERFDSLTTVWKQQGKSPFIEKDSLWEYDFEDLVIYSEDSTWGKSWFYEIGKNESKEFSYIRPYFFRISSDSIEYFTDLPRYKNFLIHSNGEHWSKYYMQKEFHSFLRDQIALDCEFKDKFMREMFKDTVKISSENDQDK